MVQDLTKGHPRQVLVRFALPAMVSVLFQQFYNMADNIVAGQFLGDNALSAVSISGPVTMLYMAVALGINIGCSVVFSQLFGAKRMEQLKSAISTALIASSAVALLLTVLGLLLCAPLLRLLSTPEDLLWQTGLYLRIYTAGLFFIFLYNTCTGVFTALGDTVTPLIFLGISSLSNVGINILFVTVCGMDVDGLAWATFLCQAAAGILSLMVLLRRLRKIPSGSFSFFSRPLLKTISRLAIPGICQKCFISVGNLLVQSCINRFESTVPGIIGGFSSATKLVYLIVYITSSVSSSMASFTAQNIGAQKEERIPQGLRSCFFICTCIVIPSSLLLWLLPETAMSVFVSSESAAVIRAGVSYLRIVAPFTLLVSLKQSFDGILHGAGAAGEFMTSTFLDLILRVILAYILPIWFGAVGIWWAWPIGWGLSACLSLWFYRRGRWKEVHLLESA